MVDGRKALISYKGKEGGDHYYGKILLRVGTVTCMSVLTRFARQCICHTR